MFVRPELLKPDWSRDRIMAEVSAAGVPCYSGSCSEIYLEKAFEQPLHGVNLRPGERYPVARELGETSLMLLVHPTLSEENISAAIRVVKEVVTRATR